MLRILSPLIAVIVVASCSGREPGRQDAKRAPDQREQSGEAPPSSRGAATAATAPTGVELDALTERRVDDRFGFELAFPDGWTSGEGPGVPALYVSSPRESPSDAFVENVNVVVEPLQAPMTVESYADGSAPLMQADLAEYRELSRRTVELAGQPAIRREYQHTFAGRPLWVVSYLVVVELRAYVITATTERELAETWGVRLDAIARSFRLTTG